MVIVERLLIAILCIAVFRAHRKINDLTLFVKYLVRELEERL